MSEYEQAEQDVAAAKVAERIAEWKAMEAKAAYYRYASEAMAASAEVMGSRIRRDNALAAEFVEKATRASHAPAQPVHPDAELRSVPGAEEKVRDQLLTAFEDDHIVERGPLIDAQTCEEVDPRVSWKADMVGATTGPWEPEIPAGFTKWEGGRRPIEIGTHIEAITADGKKSTWVTSDAIMDEQVNWELDGSELDIIAYRILSQAVETDQPEVPEIEETLKAEPSALFTETLKTIAAMNAAENPDRVGDNLDVLDATVLPQVTPDEVPPTAEVIHTDDGRKRFALFSGQTHEVVSGSGNPDADFWANVLHPKPKVDA